MLLDYRFPDAQVGTQWMQEMQGPKDSQIARQLKQYSVPEKGKGTKDDFSHKLTINMVALLFWVPFHSAAPILSNSMDYIPASFLLEQLQILEPNM